MFKQTQYGNTATNALAVLVTKIKTLSILDVSEKLGHYNKTKFTQVGENMAGECFVGHPSTSGISFHFTPDINLYQCFNCGVGGDTIKYVKDHENLTFNQAIAWIANNFPKLNITPEDLKIVKYKPPTPEELAATLKERKITDLYTELIIWGKSLLYAANRTPGAEQAYKYLTVFREYDEAKLQLTDISFIPSTLEARQHLLLKFPDATAEISSLRLTGTYGEKFTVVIPYKNDNGSISGIVRRHPSEKGMEVLNKAGDKVFARWDSTYGTQKRSLYGLHRYMRKKAVRLILVEGYPDAEYLSSYDIQIAALGSGRPSKDQIKNLATHKNLSAIYLSLDNDGAGKENILSTVEDLMKVTSLPIYVLPGKKLNILDSKGNITSEPKDLDEFFRHHRAKLGNGDAAINLVKKKVISEATLALSWYFESIKEKYYGAFPVDQLPDFIKMVTTAGALNKELFIEYLRHAKDKDLPLSVFKAKLQKSLKAHQTDMFSKDVAGNPLAAWDHVPFYGEGSGEMFVFERSKQLPKVEEIHPKKQKGDEAFNRIHSFKRSKDAFLNYLALHDITPLEVYPELKIEYNPTSLFDVDLDNATINTYVPSRWQFYKKNEEIIIPEQHFPVTAAYIDHLINDGAVNAGYFWNWLSAAWNKGRVIDTAWILTGVQGSGKNTLSDILLSGLWGCPNVITVSNEELEDKNNGYLFTKQWVVYNEINEYEGRSNPSMYNKLKAQVSDMNQTRREKYLTTAKITDYSFKMILSNAGVPIKIEPKERRYIAVSLPRVMLMDAPFMKELGIIDFDDFINRVEAELPIIAQYLLNYDYDLHLATHPPSNATLARMKGSSASPADRVVNIIRDEDIQAIHDEQQDGGLYARTHPDLVWAQVDIDRGIIPKELVKKLVELFTSSNRASCSITRAATILDSAGFGDQPNPCPRMAPLNQKNTTRISYFVINPAKYDVWKAMTHEEKYNYGKDNK